MQHNYEVLTDGLIHGNESLKKGDVVSGEGFGQETIDALLKTKRLKRVKAPSSPEDETTQPEGAKKG